MLLAADQVITQINKRINKWFSYLNHSSLLTSYVRVRAISLNFLFELSSPGLRVHCKRLGAKSCQSRADF